MQHKGKLSGCFVNNYRLKLEDNEGENPNTTENVVYKDVIHNGR
jgi:hypothetical protein